MPEYSLSFYFMHWMTLFRLKTLCKWEVVSSEKRFPCMRFSIARDQFASSQLHVLGEDQKCHLLQPITFTAPALVCLVAVGGMLLAVVTDSRSWWHLQEGWQHWHVAASSPARLSRERFCVRLNPRRQCLPLGPLLTFLDDALVQNLHPWDYFSF